MSMIIGKFTYDNASDTYSGELYSRALPSKVTLTPNAKRSDKAPDYRVVAGAHELGGGWKRTSKEKGRPFISVHIDDPALPAALDATLGENGDLIWNRDRAPAPAVQAAA